MPKLLPVCTPFTVTGMCFLISDYLINNEELYTLLSDMETIFDKKEKI